MSAEDEVLEASDQFYVALNRVLNGDADPMLTVWSHGPDVTAMYPVGGREVAWNAVRDSWERVAELSSDGTVGLQDQLIRVAGEVAYELGTENVEMTLAGAGVSGELRVTNIYRREDGTWKIVHHHTDIHLRMLELVDG